MPVNQRGCLAVVLLIAGCISPGVGYADISDAADDEILGAAAYRNAFPDGVPRDFEAAVWQSSVERALKFAKSLPDGVNTVGAHGHTALEIAVYRHDVSMVEALLNAGAHPNGTPDRAPLAISLHDGRTSSFNVMAKLLIKAGADVDATYAGSRAIDMACLDGDRTAIDALIGLHTDLDANPGGIEPPVIRVAENGDWSLVQFLLQRGASMWTMDPGGYTLGNLAALHGDPAELALALGPQSSPKLLAKQTLALELTVQYLKQAGYPWPAPGPAEMKKLQASGHWPPAVASHRTAK